VPDTSSIIPAALAQRLAALSPTDREAVLARALETVEPKARDAARVAVRDRNGQPLAPCRPARARLLVAAGKAQWLQGEPPAIQLQSSTG
jgi:hypothetical protein